GIEYFIETADIGGLDDREPAGGYFSVQVSVADVTKTGVQPGGSEQTAYRLISIPLDLDDKTPSAVFEDDLGKYDDSAWRFFELRAGETYAEFPNTSVIEPGKAFWLIVKDGGKRIDTGPGKSKPTDEPFTFSLRPGWNLIGNPFNFAIPLDNVSLASGDSVHLRRYKGFWNDPDRNQVLELAPFEGYALFNNSNSLTTLSIDPDLTVVGRLFKENPKRAHFEETSWSIQIMARCQQAQDFDNIALAVSGASEEWDAMDSPEPPVIGEYVSVYFPHTEWGKPTDKFCTDARPANAEGITWNFEVVTNIRDKVTLTFEQLENVPEEFQVWLLDEVAHVSQNLRENKVYDVAGAGRKHRRQLKLIVGKPDFVNELLRETRVVPSSFELFQNFPNPFNPSTTIRYGLPKQETVTLTIYNILGGEVVRLVNDQLKEPGYHAAVWDGRDHRGRVVASGVFFMRLQAGRFVQVRKMLMIQ
ncbi:MAG: T9SS type A sorting domain-containing protein, partial [bacterium]